MGAQGNKTKNSVFIELKFWWQKTDNEKIIIPSKLIRQRIRGDEGMDRIREVMAGGGGCQKWAGRGIKVLREAFIEKMKLG